MLYSGRCANNMTYSMGRALFPASGTLCRIAAAFALAGLAACSTSNMDSPAPSAMQSDAAGPKDTGAFPHLNIAPQNAAPQLTDAQASAKLAQLKADQAAAQRGARGGGTGATAAELNSLAADRGRKTLKQIESKQARPGCDPALDPTCK